MPKKTIPDKKNDQEKPRPGKLSGETDSRLTEENNRLRKENEELRAMLGALQVKEEHLSILMEHNPSLIFIKDKKGKYVYINKAYERQFIGTKQWLGKTDFDIWPRDSAKLFRAHDRDVLRHGQVLQFLEDSTDFEGKRHCWLCYKFPFTDSRGKQFVGGIGIDATDRVLFEEALRSSEEMAQAILNASDDSIFLLDPNGIVLAANEACARRLDTEPSKLVGRSMFDFLPAEVAQRRKVLFEEIVSKGLPVRYEDERSGLLFTTYAIPLRDKSGQINRVVMYGFDITEKTRMDDKLRQSEERYRRLFTDAALGIFHSTLDDRFIDVNPALAHMLGYESPTDVMESVHSISKQVYVDPPRRDLILEELLAKGKTIVTENEYYRKSGEKWTGRLHVRQVSDSGIPLYLEGFLEDITDLKKAGKTLIESERNWRNLVEVFPECILVHEKGTIRYVNPAGARLLGCNSPEEIIGRSVWDIIPKDRLAAAKTRVRSVEEEGMITAPMEYDFVRFDGSNFMGEIRGTPILYNGNRCVQAILRDVTDRKRIEAELRKSHDELEQRVAQRTEEIRHLAGAVHNALDGIILAHDYKIFYANPAFMEITGYSQEELIDQDASLLRSDDVPGSFYKDIRKRILADKKWSGIYPSKRKDGTTIYLHQQVSVIEATSVTVFICRDVTEKLQLEEQLIQSHKMEAIGTLAGGIAHDFNNILAAIIGFSEMIEEDLPQNDPSTHHIKNVLKAASRGRDLVKQILSFSRKDKQERSATSLSSLVKETVELLRPMIPASIQLDLEIDATEDTVIASPVEVQQMIMNLATNAAFAMSKEGGVLGITLANIDLLTDPSSGLEPGSYIQLTVKDTGTGMTPEVMDRIFDPFFTTKGQGKGTGMGLAVVYGIVQDLRGAITVKSKQGEGSIFSIMLPLVHTGRKETDLREIGLNAVPADTSKHILFVDDEELLVEWGRHALEGMGYKVTAVTDSAEALAIFKDSPSAFDLVFTDQTMPNMTGLHLAREILKVRPDMPIMIATGYNSESLSLRKVKRYGIKKLLTKPIYRKEMAKAIQEAFDTSVVITN